jgi:hypothetical protein
VLPARFRCRPRAWAGLVSGEESAIASVGCRELGLIRTGLVHLPFLRVRWNKATAVMESMWATVTCSWFLCCSRAPSASGSAFMPSESVSVITLSASLSIYTLSVLGETLSLSSATEVMMVGGTKVTLSSTTAGMVKTAALSLVTPGAWLSALRSCREAGWGLELGMVWARDARDRRSV